MFIKVHGCNTLCVCQFNTIALRTAKTGVLAALNAVGLKANRIYFFKGRKLAVLSAIGLKGEQVFIISRETTFITSLLLL